MAREIGRELIARPALQHGFCRLVFHVILVGRCPEATGDRGSARKGATCDPGGLGVLGSRATLGALNGSGVDAREENAFAFLLAMLAFHGAENLLALGGQRQVSIRFSIAPY